MQWRNSPTSYGLTSIALHWLVALAVFGLFGLGFWMVGLTYYSSWYRTAPDLHKSVGVMLFMVMLLRVFWRFVSPAPAPLASQGRLTRRAAKLGHGFLYLGLFRDAVGISDIHRRWPADHCIRFVRRAGADHDHTRSG